MYLTHFHSLFSWKFMFLVWTETNEKLLYCANKGYWHYPDRKILLTRLLEYCDIPYHCAETEFSGTELHKKCYEFNLFLFWDIFIASYVFIYNAWFVTCVFDFFLLFLYNFSKMLCSLRKWSVIVFWLNFRHLILVKQLLNFFCKNHNNNK